MKILKTVYVSDAVPGHLLTCDTIEYQGKFWLVPEWTENNETGKMRPVRIICLSSLPHLVTPGASHGDFLIEKPIPKCVFDGVVPLKKEGNFVIV